MAWRDRRTHDEECEQDRRNAGRRRPRCSLPRVSRFVIVGALIASTLLRMFLVQVFVIPSGSMENTLQIGDRVAVQKVVPFQRGDIVVFRTTSAGCRRPAAASLRGGAQA